MSVKVFVGLIRCGKTTHAIRTARKFWRKYPDSPVYTNIPDLSGAYFIDFYSFDTYRVWDKGTGHALYICDEASTEINNRDFKSFPKASRNWIALCGHEKCDLVVYSQAVDFDATIMHKATDLYTLKRMGPWTIARRWFQSFQADPDSMGCPRPAWQRNPFPVDFQQTIFRPRWYRYFNSWWSPFDHLPDVPDSLLIPELTKETPHSADVVNGGNCSE